MYSTIENKIFNWKDISQIVDEFGQDNNWLFRGQNNWSWDLKTSIERAAEDYDIDINKLENIEQGLIRKYKRHYPYYMKHQPRKDDYIEWLSIMQHYGAPTRLLDFTYSFYIALFFAINNAKIGQEIAIWCIDADWIQQKYRESATTEYSKLLEIDKERNYKEVYKYVLNNKKDGLYGVTPFYLNVRLTIQQGTFIIPLNIKKTFMENMNAIIVNYSDNKKIQKIKVNLSKTLYKQIIYNLNRMNINNAVLFNGLDGFSRNMKNIMMFENMRYSLINYFI